MFIVTIKDSLWFAFSIGFPWNQYDHLWWSEIPVSYTSDLIKLYLWLVNKTSIVEGNRLLKETLKTGTFQDQMFLKFFHFTEITNFLFSGITLKSLVSVKFWYMVQKKL